MHLFLFDCIWSYICIFIPLTKERQKIVCLNTMFWQNEITNLLQIVLCQDDILHNIPFWSKVKRKMYQICKYQNILIPVELFWHFNEFS